MTPAEAHAAAAAEGLALVPAANATGFKGVYRNGQAFEAKVSGGGKLQQLGSFSTVEEAALAYSRHIAARTRRRR